MKYKVDNSLIVNGLGTIATEDIAYSVLIDVWVSKTRVDNIRCLSQDTMTDVWFEYPGLGRYSNHSETPNTYYELDGNNVNILSNGILINEEITVNYNWCTSITGYTIDLTNFK
jgi:hypothetical protein